MGSGYFPISKQDEPWFSQLKGATNAVEEFCGEISDSIYSGDSGGNQFDNAASDGASLALLRLAAKLIRAELREEA